MGGTYPHSRPGHHSSDDAGTNTSIENPGAHLGNANRYRGFHLGTAQERDQKFIDLGRALLLHKMPGTVEKTDTPHARHRFGQYVQISIALGRTLPDIEVSVGTG